MASKGVNRAIILGNLGAEPVTNQTGNGTAVSNLSVATNETWRDRNTGEKQERTEWHKVTCWGKLSDIADQYLQKGDRVYIEGKIQTRKWQDQNGQDRYTTEINAAELVMLGSSQGTESSNPEKSRPGPRPSQQAEQAAAKLPDDDVPF